MSYSRYMDRSLDDMAEDMHHPRRERDSPDRRTEVDKDRTLFVANLNYNTSWQELKEHLRKAGPIERCDIFKDSGGYSKGFGLIVFGDAESADRALREYNDSVLNDRNMKLRKARPGTDRRDHKEYSSNDSSASRRGRPPQDPASTVFVHNLDYNVTWQKLKDIFKVVGRVIDVEVLEGRKGVAVIQFGNPDDAIKAIALFHGQMLMDRPMQLRMDSKAPYQPDPLKLKLSSVQGSADTSHSEHSRHSRHETRHDRQDSYPRHESHYSRPRSRSPLYHTSTRDYSYSPPARYGNGYSNSSREPSRREDSYHRDSERDEREHYYRQESRSYTDRSHGFERSERPRYSGRSRSRSPIRERRRSFSPRGDQEYITSVFVKNLPFSTTWQNLKDEFRKAGLVKRAEIKMNKEGRPSGLALVYYDTHKDALNAVSMFNDTNFDGRHINVQLNNMHPRPRY